MTFKPSQAGGEQLVPEKIATAAGRHVLGTGKCVQIAPEELPEAADALSQAGARLVDLSGWRLDSDRARVLLTLERSGSSPAGSDPGGKLVVLEAELRNGRLAYPSITPVFRVASWYERALYDSTGIMPEGHPNLLPLWKAEAGVALPHRTSGEGVFMIPYGPVRSGIFESGAYLVETPGEEILHVRILLHHKHRGIERRFTGLDLGKGLLLAERVEGVASVAHAIAYAQAVERLCGIESTPGTDLTRLVLAELERISNHLDSFTRAAEAAGLAVAVARFSHHKEQTMRLMAELCSSRFGRNGVAIGSPGYFHIPGSIRRELADAWKPTLDDLEAFFKTPSMVDRLRSTGPLDSGLALAAGALGPVGRASGAGDDVRRTRPYGAYGPSMAHPGHGSGTPSSGDTLAGSRSNGGALAGTPSSGDAVAAADQGDALSRMAVRAREISESFRLLEGALARLTDLPAISEAEAAQVERPIPPAGSIAAGWAEAPQGEVFYLVETGADGHLSHVVARSASFHNLALFPSTFQGDILTDFAFIEASFGCSIAGAAR